jgi:hypothetical protein
LTKTKSCYRAVASSFSVAGLVCLLFLNGCVISPRRTPGGTGGNGGGGGTAAGGKLYVTTGDSILRFDNAFSVRGNIAPAAAIAGALTTLSTPRALQIDAATDRLYVANQRAGSILVFSPASTATGNVAPSAILAGSNTGLSSPVAIALDTTRNILYVADGTTIFVYGNIASLSGPTNTGAAQSFVAGFTISGMFVDPANNILYVADAADNIVAVFQSANTQTGIGFAAQTIVGPDTGLSKPTGVVLDPAGRLFVSNPGTPSLTAYPNPTVTTGDALPAVIIQGNSTGLNSPAQMAATNSVSNGALFVADPTASVVLVYSPISTVTGNVNLAPSAQFAGATTTLSNPLGIAVDSTR